MFNLTVAVILHGITLTGNLGSINYPYCDTIAKYLSGDNWVVSCITSPGSIALPSTLPSMLPDSGWTSCTTNPTGQTLCQ